MGVLIWRQSDPQRKPFVIKFHFHPVCENLVIMVNINYSCDKLTKPSTIFLSLSTCSLCKSTCLISLQICKMGDVPAGHSKRARVLISHIQREFWVLQN